TFCVARSTNIVAVRLSAPSSPRKSSLPLPIAAAPAPESFSTLGPGPALSATGSYQFSFVLLPCQENPVSGSVARQVPSQPYFDGSSLPPFTFVQTGFSGSSNRQTKLNIP